MSSLRGAIIRGELVGGQKLPSEPELAAQLGVSRPVLREALKGLEMSGYLEVRRGYGGGTFVTNPEPAEFLTIKRAPLSTLDVAPHDVMHARLAIEPAAARLAAGNGHVLEASRALHRLALPGARPAQIVGGMVEFHLAVVEATRNAIFIAVLHSLRGPMAVDLNTRVQDPEWSAACRDGLAHLLDRLDSGDGPGAEKAMRHHLIEHENVHGIGDGQR